MNTATAKITRTNRLPVRLVTCAPVKRTRQGEPVELVAWQIQMWTPKRWVPAVELGRRSIDAIPAQPYSPVEDFAAEGVA